MTDKETQMALDKIEQLTIKERYKLPADELTRLEQFEHSVYDAEFFLGGALDIFDSATLAPYKRCAEKYFPERYKEAMHKHQKMKEKKERKEKFITIMNITLFILLILGVLTVFIVRLVS